MRISAVAVCAFALSVAPLPAAAQFTAALVPPNAMLIDSTPRAALPAAPIHAHGSLTLPGSPTHIDSSLGAIDSAFASSANPSVISTVAEPGSEPNPRRTVETSDSDADSGAVFRDGASAPETATPLPMIALLGAGALRIGGALFRR